MPAGTLVAPPSDRANQPPQMAGVPFPRASFKFCEGPLRTDTVIVTGSAQEQTPINIPPGGFLRGLWIEVSGASGSLGSATLGADYPFSLISSITVENINGAPIFGPLTGYQTYQVNKWGGYFPSVGGSDPVDLTGYVATIVAPFFYLWVPLEIRNDGWGSLANTDARSQYRLKVTVAADTDLRGSTAFATDPTLTLKYYSETWAQPEAQSLEGLPQVQAPPALNTIQFWSRDVQVIAASALTMKHNRVGNLDRNWIYILRTNAAATASVPATPRSDLMGDPIRIRLDNRYLRIESPNVRKQLMARRGQLAVSGANTPALDTGVYVYNHNLDLGGSPSPGDEGNYLRTTQASFLAIEDTFTGAGTIEIITNDIAVPQGAAYPQGAEV